MGWTNPDISTIWTGMSRRVLNNGFPNTGKTTSISTMPGPVAYVAYPGELGVTSVSSTTTDGQPIVPYVWKKEGEDHTKTYAEIGNLVSKLRKSGKYRSLALDGIHKFYEVCLNIATNGDRELAKDFEASKYGPAHVLFRQHVEMALEMGEVENVMVTCWAELEADDREAKARDTSKHMLPRLPGKQAVDIMGEFAVVVYSEREGAGAAARYLWQTAPGGKIWGAGAKLPRSLWGKIPARIPQDYTKLMSYLHPGGK